jgi:hypothetical protein
MKYSIARINDPTKRYDKSVSGERLLILTVENAISKSTNMTYNFSVLISNWPTSISVSQISVRPTKHAVISGVLEITIPANIAIDRIY